MERIAMYSIAYKCPHFKREKSCPLMGIESLPFKGKVDWLKFQPEEKIFSIMGHHFKCSRRREEI
jgi:hypothetical protein